MKHAWSINSYQPVTLIFIRKIELLHRSLDLNSTCTCNIPYTGFFCDDLFSIFLESFLYHRKNIQKLCQLHMYYVLLKTFKIPPKFKKFTYLLQLNLQHKNNLCYLVPLNWLDSQQTNHQIYLKF